MKEKNKRMPIPNSEKTKVVIICAADVSVKVLLRPQITAMQRAGYNVTAVCSDGALVQELRDGGLRVETVDILRRISPWRDIKALFRLVRLFKRLEVDIVHTHTPKAAFLGQIAAKLAGAAIRINTLHGFYYFAFRGGLKRWLFKKLELFACRLATYVLSQSREDVDTAIENKLIAPEKIEWLGNGINLDIFNPDILPAGTCQNVRNEINIPQDAFVVGILARMVKEKGFEELFEAFANFRQNAPNAYLMHIGYIDRSRNEEVTPETADNFGIGPFCRFIGQRNDVPRLMAAMDIYCLPSYREGYPRSVMEANAMGLPAVVTDIRGNREAVIDGVNGLVVPVRDSGKLASAMKRLYQDKDLRDKLAAGAAKRAKEAFDERRVFQIVLNTYANQLEQLNRRPPVAMT